MAFNDILLRIDSYPKAAIDQAALDVHLADPQPIPMLMGAYGHSHVRAFILGGGGEQMLHALRTPLFLSR